MSISFLCLSAEIEKSRGDDRQAEPGFLELLEEQRRFTADKAYYTEALIALSVGPYSGIPAASPAARSSAF